MNFTNYARVWRASNPYWFKGTREWIALRLVASGHRLADLAEWVAPWRFRKPDGPVPRRPRAPITEHFDHDPDQPRR